MYRLRALEIPERERTAKGMPIVNLLLLAAGKHDPGRSSTPRDFVGEWFLFFATRRDRSRRRSFDAYGTEPA